VVVAGLRAGGSPETMRLVIAVLDLAVSGPAPLPAAALD
jgi:hypothetical protein